MNAAAVMSAGSGICVDFPANQILVSSVGDNNNGVDFQPFFCGTSTVPSTPEVSGSAVSPNDQQAKFRRVEVWFVATGGKLVESSGGLQRRSYVRCSRAWLPPLSTVVSPEGIANTLRRDPSQSTR